MRRVERGRRAAIVTLVARRRPPAVKHVLRGFDAVRLAAAVTLRDALGTDGVAFASCDDELSRAPVTEGPIVLEPAGP